MGKNFYQQIMRQSSITLHPTKHQMPLIGFGTWKSDTNKCEQLVYDAIKAGYRLIDTAQVYGNEELIGRALQRAFKEGIVKREDLFITSKLWNTYHAKEHVKPALLRTLKDLQLDYLDLFLVHFPLSQRYVDPSIRYPPSELYDIEKKTVEFEDSPLGDCWRAMEKLVDEGLVKNLGVSNYTVALLRDALSYRIKPSVLQIEYHPYLSQPTLIKYAQDHNIAVTAYSSFGDTGYQEMPGYVKNNGTVPLLDNLALKVIAKIHEKTSAQVALRWATQRNIAVIPKTNNPLRLEENLQSLSFDLKPEEMKLIDSLNIGLRYNDPIEWAQPVPLFDLAEGASS